MPCPSVHTTQAYRLVQDDRILLKDLRVLNVAAPLSEGSQKGYVRIRWFQTAGNNRGELDVPASQLLKIICGSERGCSVGREVAELI